MTTAPVRAQPIKVGLIGQGIGASSTPALHEAEGRAQGLTYRYALIDTHRDPYRDRPLAGLLSDAEAAGFTGLNITHPYKVGVIALLDDLSEAARRVGAANTVLLRGGRRLGDNTDCTGFRVAFLNELAEATRRRVLLLGAGGGASAVCHALLDLDVRHLTLFSLDIGESEDLAHRLRGHFPDRSVAAVDGIDAPLVADHDGIVNATPMGMDAYPGTAIDPGLLQSRPWVADIVYFPLETALLRHAGSLGCRVMSGAGMAVHQAAEAFRIFTGRPADATRMAACFRRLQQSTTTRTGS